eukprot:573808-Pelagomonas_calceolata.AAC.1
MRHVGKFRLRAHYLKVEFCKWLGGSNICDECECAEVQGEKHAVFSVTIALRCELCRKYKDLINGLSQAFKKGRKIYACRTAVMH